MKPSWSKVYIGPGYPIDPAKEEARSYRSLESVMPDWNHQYPNKSYSDGSLYEMLTKAEKAHLFQGVDPGAEIQKPSQDYAKFAELLSSGQIAFPKESAESISNMFDAMQPPTVEAQMEFVKSINSPTVNILGYACKLLGDVDPSYSCVITPPEKHHSIPGVFDAEVYAQLLEDEEKIMNNKHVRRCMMVHTEDFQSRLMAIEVKERGI